MRFKKSDIRITDHKIIKREGKKELQLITIADKTTYEAGTFLLNKDSAKFTIGDDVDVELIFNGKYVTLRVV